MYIYVVSSDGHLRGVIDINDLSFSHREQTRGHNGEESHEVDGDLDAEDCAPPPSHSTGVNRSGLRMSAFEFGQSSRWIVIPRPSEM